MHLTNMDSPIFSLNDDAFGHFSGGYPEVNPTAIRATPQVVALHVLILVSKIKKPTYLEQEIDWKKTGKRHWFDEIVKERFIVDNRPWFLCGRDQTSSEGTKTRINFLTLFHLFFGLLLKMSSNPNWPQHKETEKKAYWTHYRSSFIVLSVSGLVQTAVKLRCFFIKKGMYREKEDEACGDVLMGWLLVSYSQIFFYQKH